MSLSVAKRHPYCTDNPGMKLSLRSISPKLLLWLGLCVAFLVQYTGFIRELLDAWLSDAEFSYGIIIPAIVAYLIWSRRDRLREAPKRAWIPALVLVVIGCALQLLASVSGTLVLSGLAFVISLMGITGFLWGPRPLRIVIVPLAFLLLMVPLPSYLLGELTWYLQVAASTISGAVLGALGVPVYQDGNLLKLPNYVLEVKEACSGSRSIFALLAMALLLGLTMEKKWRVRIPLVLAAPLLAIVANVIRIVGTGLLAWQFGGVAANESLHTAWGVVVFLIAVTGLLAFERLLRWAANAYA